MKAEYSGNIYKLELEYNRGYAYAQILDFTDVSNFDGILVRVFKVIDKTPDEKREIKEIVSSGILLGPLPINKYPNRKGKGSWFFCGKDESVISMGAVVFKKLRGVLDQADWSTLKPWFKYYKYNSEQKMIEVDSEEVRGLDTLILNHIQMIKVKVTMMLIIASGERVKDYYNFEDLTYRVLYMQIVNTYYSKELAEKLLRELP